MNMMMMMMTFPLMKSPHLCEPPYNYSGYVQSFGGLKGDIEREKDLDFVCGRYERLRAQWRNSTFS